MSSRALLLAFAVLAVAGILAALLWGPGVDHGSAAESKPAIGGVDDRAPLSQDAAPARREEALAPGAPVAVAAPTGPAIAPRAVSTLRVLVRDPDGAPVPGAAVRLRPDAGPRLDGLDVPEERGEHRPLDTDASGVVRFEGVQVGLYEIEVRKQIRGVAVTASETSVEIVLAPSKPDLTIRVVDERNEPVAGARVELVGDRSSSTTTDDRGVARVPDSDFSGGVVTATAKDGRAGQTIVRLREGVDRAIRRGGVVVTVAATGGIEGELRGLPPEGLARARVLAWALDNPNPYYTTHGRNVAAPVAGGRYRFEKLPAGTWSLSLDDPQGARLALPAIQDFGGLENSVDPIEVVVASGRTTVQDLEVARGGAIEGLVRRRDGAPVRDADVLDTFAPATTNYPDGFLLHGVNVWRFDTRDARADHPVSHPRTRTDERGRYRLAGLMPGRHRVEVIASGLSYDRVEGVAVADATTVSLEHVLEAAGAIQGVDPRAGYLGVVREGEREPRMIAVLPGDGRFTFAGLAPGRYGLAQFHSDAKIAPVHLIDVDVEAGRTSWVDMAAASRPVRIAGRVVDAHGPVAGVRVRLHPQYVVTDAAGRFETRVSFAHTYMVLLRVEREGVETSFEYPGMGKDETDWDQDLVLGRETLAVRTQDDRGVPARAKLEFRSTDLSSAGHSIQSVSATDLDTGGPGERTLEDLPAGTYDVRARFENGAEARVTVTLPAEGPLVLRAPATGDLVVVARLANGEPVQGRAVRARTTIPGGEKAQYAFRWGETDAEGRARLSGVTAGDVLVDVRLSRGGWGGDEGVLASEPVRLAPGEERAISFVVERR